jgi:hypothetical protein
MSSGLSVVVSAPCVITRDVPVICTPEPSARPTAYLLSPEDGAPGGRHRLIGERFELGAVALEIQSYSRSRGCSR